MSVNLNKTRDTGGSTGVSLSLVCAVKGYPLDIVTSDAFTREKLDHMRLLGAKLKVVPSDSGRMTEKLTRGMIEADITRKRRSQIVDRAAAAYILQGLLDRLARSGAVPP